MGIVLRKHQKEFLNHEKGLKDHAVLEWKVGLGKTFASIFYMLERFSKSNLIIAPKTTFPDWIKALESLDQEVRVASGKFRLSSLVSARTCWTLINPEGLRIEVGNGNLEKFKNNFTGLIVDELTRFRRKSKQTAALRKFAKEIQYKIGLTGQLVVKDLTDCYNPMNIIFGEKTFGVNYYKFMNRFFVKVFKKNEDDLEEGQRNFFDWVPTDVGRTMISAILAENLHRLDYESTGIELPEEVSLRHYIQLSTEQVKMIRELLHEWTLTLVNKTDDQKLDSWELSSASSIMQKEAQIASGFVYTPDGDTKWLNYNPKLQCFQGVIEEIGSEKFIVWCMFKAEVVLVQKFLEDKGYTISLHEEEEDKQVLITTIPKNYQGRNWQTFRHAIFFSITSNYEHYFQSKGRTHRQGSKHPTVIFHHLLTNTRVDKLKSLALAARHSMQLELLTLGELRHANFNPKCFEDYGTL